MDSSKFKFLKITFKSVEEKCEAVSLSKIQNVANANMRFGFSYTDNHQIIYLVLFKNDKTLFEKMADHGLCTKEEISAEDFKQLDPRNNGNKHFNYYGEIQFSPWKNMDYYVTDFAGFL